ncbi:MAG: L,D-transpeptidase family protein [Coriobacteriia bacterium]|nr:L,D-transpeptidase family protein [Coriobacteriia bacterium]
MSTCLHCNSEIGDEALESCPECGWPLPPVAEQDGPGIAEVSVAPPGAETLAGSAGGAAASHSSAPPASRRASRAEAMAAERRRVSLIAVAVVGVAILGAVVATALLAWPQPGLSASPDALAGVRLPGFAGRVIGVEVRSASGARVPARLTGQSIWPIGQLGSGEWLTVDVTVARPVWIGWLVGSVRSSRLTLQTPRASLRETWLQVKDGLPAYAVFDTPVRVVAVDGSSARRLPKPQATVSLGVLAHGGKSAGQVEVSSAARSWERVSAPVRVNWFAARPYRQALAEPSTAGTITPTAPLKLTFSGPVDSVLGQARPKVTPTVAGSWRELDAHTLAFQPSGTGFGLATTVRVELPVAVHLAGQRAAQLTRTVQWQVASGSTLRLQQLLAQLGYLPVSWQPSGTPVASSAAAQIAAALSPPPGAFSWRYPSTPRELQEMWHVGRLSEITYGAIMTFEDTHGLPADGVAGPTVWSALINDALAGKARTVGYSYVFVHRNEPQSLTLWHNGRVILTSPGNTGVPAAPTQLGTFPVFEHIPVGTMSGTNPDGTHYNDPGIRWISYFNGGDAIHSFNRASFGTPQSLGCVELPLAAAAKVWPYTPIGTLVTIEK